MKVLLGSTLALVLLAAAPVYASSAGAVGSEGGEGMYDEGAAPDTEAQAPDTQTQAPGAQDGRAQDGQMSRAERRALREQRRAERAARRAAKAQGGDRAERRAHRKRQFAMGERVPPKFLRGRRVITDYSRFGVHPPRGGDQWVRGRKQLLLVSADGVVKHVIVRQKRRHRDRGELPIAPDRSDQPDPSDQTEH